MARNIIIAGVLFCSCLSQVTLGQVQIKSTVMKPAIIFRPNQDAIRGKLAQIGDSNIVVVSSEHEVTIPIADINRIILTDEQGAGRGPVYGAVLVGYASAYILATSQDHGGFVESRTLPLFLIVVVPSIALGTGIGYLVDQGYAQQQEVFDFTGTDEANAREKSRLLRAATRGLGESKVHLTFQGSQVNASSHNSSISEFNMLRKVQLTYSVVPDVEVGVAFVWFGEPPQSADGFEILSNGDFNSYYTSQTSEATGRYIVALYKPFYHVLDPWLDMKVGGGIGIASIDFKRLTSPSTNMPQGSYFNVSENVIVGYLFGEIEFELVNGLSVGFVADKVFGPSRDAPAVPQAKIPAQTIDFGNTSVGFTVSFHF